MTLAAEATDVQQLTPFSWRSRYQRLAAANTDFGPASARVAWPQAS
jgi:hypothetical protein